MKNVQIIDDAINCTFDIFEIEDSDFSNLFPNGTDVEFEPDLFNRLGEQHAKLLLTTLWKRRVDKKVIRGIHGTLFFGDSCDDRRPFYPSKKESEMIANP